jgi:RNA polymerase sigma-70 factor, ECF subfamily
VIVTDRRLGGEIKDVALLDLTPLTSAEDVAGITRISDVAVVLVPESLMGAVTAIPSVWRRLSEVAPLAGERQRAWIFTVARNLAIDSYRAGATRRAAEASLRQAAATQEATMAGPHLETEHAERLAQLEAAIRELPEEQRVILSMATAGGLTSRQIGEALGEPPGTVRYRLSQARKQLAAALDLEDQP